MMRDKDETEGEGRVGSTTAMDDMLLNNVRNGIRSARPAR